MRVLVVDDDPGARLVAQATVEQAGHECLLASDGDAAWRVFQRRRPHVVVTDWVMPGLDGLALCRAIRGAADVPYTYLILVTSRGTHEEILAGTEAGGDDYLSKPLDPFTLRARLLVAERVTSLHARLAHYREELSQQARTDPLTGLHNRLKLTEDLTGMRDAGERYGRDYCLALCDVDCFKAFNDAYGHQAGDAALRAVGAALASQARKSDGLYRYGGEEFLLLLPELTERAAVAAVDRFRAAVQELQVVHQGGPAGVITLSVGVSRSWAGHRVSNDQLLREADEALYVAKATGRNRVVMATTANRVA